MDTGRDLGDGWFGYAALPAALGAQVWVLACACVRRLLPARQQMPDERWDLHPEGGGWALRPMPDYPIVDRSGPPRFFTDDVRRGDVEGARAWARTRLRGVHHVVIFTP